MKIKIFLVLVILACCQINGNMEITDNNDMIADCTIMSNVYYAKLFFREGGVAWTEIDNQIDRIGYYGVMKGKGNEYILYLKLHNDDYFATFEIEGGKVNAIKGIVNTYHEIKIDGHPHITTVPLSFEIWSI